MKKTLVILALLAGLTIVGSVCTYYLYILPAQNQEWIDPQKSTISDEEFLQMKQDIQTLKSPVKTNEIVYRKSDFDLKKECAEYIPQYENEVEKEMGWRRESADNISVFLEGVFYSKKLNTCVAVIKTNNPALLGTPNIDTSIFPRYYDALTGRIITEDISINEVFKDSSTKNSVRIEEQESAFDFVK